MTSSRNSRVAGRPDPRTEEDALLDAARDCVLAVGLRRTTLTDVARRAGVSRMTIYRRWPDITTMVADLMTRELGALTRAATEAAGGSGDTAGGGSDGGRGDGQDGAAGADGADGPAGPAGADGADGADGAARPRFVAAVVAAARALRHHPLFRRIVELDPEVLLPYLVQRRGTSQEQMLAMMTGAIADGTRDGSIRTGDPDLLARGVLLAAHGFVLSLPTMTDAAGEDDLDGELRLLLDRYLAP
jgi:AcrR family transcriptional regulator